MIIFDQLLTNNILSCNVAGRDGNVQRGCCRVCVLQFQF